MSWFDSIGAVATAVGQALGLVKRAEDKAQNQSDQQDKDLAEEEKNRPPLPPPDKTS